ncbi:MAG: histidine-type phosphatase [Muribaculaceae bacterium]|nr:histidine-type phosphatase [Muribaculaceae bacterium]
MFSKIKKHLAVAAFLFALSGPFISSAESVKEEVFANPAKAGGVYYAYPGPDESLAAAPEGYEAFYISHYGRHGSRYLISDEDYVRVLDHFRKADSLGVLTPKGVEVMGRLWEVWKEADGRGGELTPLGARQHKGIARRMFQAYPTVFGDSAVITARSTQVMRCAHSMLAFCEGLKELNPSLVIPKESSKRWMSHLCWWTPQAAEWNSDRGPWKETYDDFEKANIHPERLVGDLFTSTEGLPLSPSELMWGLYWVAVDMQNMETPVSFFDMFTPDELYSLWRVNNLSFYIHNASFPMSEGLIVANARNLLDNIILTADEYIREGKSGATLRFGHDGNITPLAALMKFDGFCGEESDPEKVEEAWTNFKVTPMASNMQAIFFRPVNGDGDIIVKFMMNEHDVRLPIESSIAPFYSWTEAREFLKSQADDATAVIVRNQK